MMAPKALSILAGIVVLQLMSVPARASRPQIGLLGGMQISWALFENSAVFDRGDLDDRSIAGVLVGGTIRTSLGRPGNFSFEPGLFYSRRGGDSVWEVIGTDSQGNELPQDEHLGWRISYLSLPLHARFDVGRKDIRPYFKVGPEIGLRLSATHEEPKLDPDGGRIVYVGTDATGDIRVLDLGLSVAAGLQVSVGGIPLLAQAGYYHGLLDVLDPDRTIEDARLKNRSIALLVGLEL